MSAAIHCAECGGALVLDCEDCADVRLRVERQRTDAAQAEVGRRGDVMLATLREIERGEYNAAAMLLVRVVRP